MTFLRFAVIGSLIYLVQCMPTDIIPPVPEVAMPDYQENIENFMKDMSAAAQNHLQPLMAELDLSEQQQIVEYGINSFMSYIDYMLHVITVDKDFKIVKESEKQAIDSDEDPKFDDD